MMILERCVCLFGSVSYGGPFITTGRPVRVSPEGLVAALPWLSPRPGFVSSALPVVRVVPWNWIASRNYRCRISAVEFSLAARRSTTIPLFRFDVAGKQRTTDKTLGVSRR